MPTEKSSETQSQININTGPAAEVTGAQWAEVDEDGNPIKKEAKRKEIANENNNRDVENEATVVKEVKNVSGAQWVDSKMSDAETDKLAEEFDAKKAVERKEKKIAEARKEKLEEEASNKRYQKNLLVEKEAERERIAKKSVEKEKHQFTSNKIGRYKSGIKRAAKVAQDKKSAGLAAGNLVIADALALEYYDNEIAAKEVEDGTLTLNKENRQPSTVGLFTELFSNEFSYEEIRPAKRFEIKAKVNSKESTDSDKKNKADSLLINQYFSMANGLGKDKKKKTEDEEKIKKLYTYAKLRKFDIAKRTEKELEKQKDLEEQKRVVEEFSFEGIKNTARDAVGGKIVSFFTARKAGSSSDKRGIRGGTDFEISEDTDGKQKIEAKKIKAGLLIPPSASITQQLDAVEKKWDGKIKMAGEAKGGADIFINLSAILEAFQGVMNVGGRILSTISNYLAALGILLSPLLLVVSLIKTVTKTMKIIENTTLLCRAIFDGMAMMLNTNPALFSLLQGEAGSSLGKVANLGIGKVQQKVGKDDSKTTASFSPTGIGVKVDFGKDVITNVGGGGAKLAAGKGINESFGEDSIKNAGKGFKNGGSGHNPNSGAKMDNMTYEDGEKEMANEAFNLARGKAEGLKSKLSEDIKHPNLDKLKITEVDEGTPTKALSDDQKANLKESKGAWGTAKDKISGVIEKAKSKL